jgi:hypothetical protein
MWKHKKIQEFRRSSLLDLIGGRVPAVRLPGFADARETERLAASLLGEARRTHSIRQVARLGISQYEQGVRVSREHYFALARQLDAEFDAIYARSFNPVRRMIDRLRAEGFDAEVMLEPGLGRYFAGSGKLRNGYSPVHVDFAPQDSAGWAVGDARAQLAWNYYLQVPAQGGELLLWDRLWQPDDDRYQVADNYYYDETVVGDAPMLRVSVKPGEVVLINSRSYHAVAEAADRLAFGSFISVIGDGRLGLWS